MHESYKKWLEDGCPKVYCQCLYHEEIIITNNYKYRGIPKYISGHRKHKSYRKWLEDDCPKIICQCGCNKEIIVYEYHKWNGIPKYICGHGRKGTHHSKETKQKMRDNHVDFSGENHPMYGIHKFAESASNWQGGKSFEPYCPKFNEKKKEEVREEYNRKCYICNIDEKNNITKTNKPWKLAVHHIDDDKEQGCNDKPWKLVPLCLHCHNSKKTRIL